jgi:hypothetical protein
LNKRPSPRKPANILQIDSPKIKGIGISNNEMTNLISLSLLF